MKQMRKSQHHISCPVITETAVRELVKRLSVFCEIRNLASRRAKRDAVLLPEVKRVWDDNLKVYGVRKVWHQLRREGFDVARCTVARLMKRLGLQGVIRGKGTKTTVSDKSDPCPEDKVNRQFRAPAPNRLCPLSAASIACRVRGQRFHLCVDMAGVCLRRLRN